VLIHGYLADAHSWEKQEPALLGAGYRVVSYDRRGAGRSSRPAAGYDYDTLAADLGVLLEVLDLRDLVLVGCCAGTGEVIRYLARDGAARRVRAAALLAPLRPDGPSPSDSDRDGDGQRFLDRLPAELAADRPAAVKTFLDLSYNLDLLGGWQVSDQAWQNSFHVALGGSAAAAVGGARAWREDFRADLTRIEIPVLIVQGTHDQVMVPAASGRRLAAALANASLVEIPDGPHAIGWTHASAVNDALLDFLGAVYSV
jgi:non-heme chloroperoxidase